VRRTGSEWRCVGIVAQADLAWTGRQKDVAVLVQEVSRDTTVLGSGGRHHRANGGRRDDTVTLLPRAGGHSHLHQHCALPDPATAPRCRAVLLLDDRLNRE
jgi:hypothetical protein